MLKTWSDIDDASATEDDSTVQKKKRILRYGRSRLSEMRERFNASKEKLFEEKQHQLDIEWEQLQDGSHPQYKEYAQQIDARWLDRLSVIEHKAELDRNFAKEKHDESCQTAFNSFIVLRRELRQGLIHRRKKQLWALTDSLRNLEKIREAINNIAFPISNQGVVSPVEAKAAPRDSNHMMVIPDTELATVDKDADVSAICGIPALLNHGPDTERFAVEDDAAASGLPPGGVIAVDDDELADTHVPESLGGSVRQTQQMHVAEYGYHDHASAGTSVHGLGIGGSQHDHYYQQQQVYLDRNGQEALDPRAKYPSASNLPTIAEAPSSVDDGYAYYSNPTYTQQRQQYYGAADQVAADDYYSYRRQPSGYDADGRSHKYAASPTANASTVAVDYQQPPASQSKLNQLLHPTTADAESSNVPATSVTGNVTGAYDQRNSAMNAYYDHRPTKRDLASTDYGEALNKRQRVMPPTTEWQKTPSS
ncbi:hypothetical protein LPJ74_005967, partial [Coemansia sp. RSA 1843]